MLNKKLNIKHAELLLWNVALIAIYFGSGKLGLFISKEAGNISIIWPPAGIALAAALIFDYRKVVVPIFIGAYILTLTNGAPHTVSFGIAFGNTLSAVVGAFLLKKLVNFDNSFSSLTDVLSFVALGVIFSTVVSASIGVFTLYFAGFIAKGSSLSVFNLWRLGDLMAILVISPAILTWSKDFSLSKKPLAYAEALLQGILIAVVGMKVYNGMINPGSINPITFILLPFLIIWTAFRFKQRGAATMTLVLSTIVIIAVLMNVNNTYHAPVVDRLLSLYGFIAFVALISLLSASVIGEKINAEKKIVLSEEKYRSLFEGAGDSIFIIDPVTKTISDTNKSSEITLGYAREELIGRPFEIIEPPNSHYLNVNIYKELQERDNLIYEYEFRTKDGKNLPVEINCRIVEYGTKEVVLCMVRDISERKEMQQSLSYSEARYQRFFETLIYAVANHEIIYGKDGKPVDSRIIDVNPAYEYTFNIKRNEVLGKKASEFFDYGALLQTRLIEEVDSKKEVFKFDSYIPSLNSHFNVCIMPSQVGKFTVVLNDITARKHAEEALMDSEERLEVTLKSISDGVIALNQEGKIEFANPSGRKYLDLLTDLDIGDTLEKIGPYTIEDLLSSAYPHTVREIDNENDNERLFEVYAYSMDNNIDLGDCVLVIRDTTVERQIRMRVEGQARLAALGQLAAGIAHDFNNILSVMIGYSELLKNIPYLTQRSLGNLEIMIEQGKRGSRLISQILDFSRKSASEKSYLNLGEFIQENTRMLEHMITENIKVSTTISPGEHWIFADPSQLQQIMTNLALNAVDAMSNGGEIKIDLVMEEYLDGKTIPFPQMRPGNWLKLSVADTGSGIEREHQNHVFEPFFTTKEVGKGTGLGLSQVYGLIKQHDGFIDVQSEPGVGSTFNLYFPPQLKPELNAKPTTEPGSIVKGNGEVILLVEDEERVLITTKNMLESLGYSVVIAHDGLEAIDVYSQMKDDIDLIVTDMVMPQLDGASLIEKLRELNPEVKALVLTGYPMSEEDRKILSKGKVNWMNKPIGLKELSLNIDTLISQTLNAPYDT